MTKKNFAQKEPPEPSKSGRNDKFIRIVNIGFFVTISFAQTSCGQVVMLPTFQFFQVRTTVSVPDGGTMLLGGVKSSSSGASSRGRP